MKLISIFPSAGTIRRRQMWDEREKNVEKTWFSILNAKTTLKDSFILVILAVPPLTHTLLQLPSAYHESRRPAIGE